MVRHVLIGNDDGKTAARALPGEGAEARKVVSRMRQAGVTSVLYVGNGLFPAFTTQEATRQGYGPEWVLLGAGPGGGGGGGGLTGADTTFSGRAYDQTQWAHAFGLSFSGARLASGQDESWRIHAWHTFDGDHPQIGARIERPQLLRGPWSVGGRQAQPIDRSVVAR